MSPEELVVNLQRRPFVPLRITLSEGNAYEVHHPELCMAGRRSAIIGLTAPGATDLLFERSVTVDLLHIVKLEPLERRPPPSTDGAG